MLLKKIPIPATDGNDMTCAISESDCSPASSRQSRSKRRCLIFAAGDSPVCAVYRRVRCSRDIPICPAIEATVGFCISVRSTNVLNNCTVRDGSSRVSCKREINSGKAHNELCAP